MFSEILIFILATLLGGCLPFGAKKSDAGLHLLVALGTGLFLGLVFLHLLPDLAERSHDPAVGHDVWAFLLLGVVGLFLLENVLLANPDGSDRGRHVTVGWVSFLGLCIHAFVTGVSLSGIDSEARSGLLVPMAGHKLAEGFSLATVFLLAGFSRRRVLLLVLAFALVTPVGLGFGSILTDSLSAGGTARLTALATGTFLFVALVDLLPEVFHRRGSTIRKMFLLLVGILLSLWFEGGGHH